MKLGKLLQQNESDITPDTYELPKDINQLKEKIEKNGGIYIAKPSEGSQGDGIKLISGVKDIPDKSEYVVQRYIQNCLLVKGLKFDFRVYVILTGLEPMTGYVCDEGLVRFCTVSSFVNNKGAISETKYKKLEKPKHAFDKL